MKIWHTMNVGIFNLISTEIPHNVKKKKKKKTGDKVWPRRFQRSYPMLLMKVPDDFDEWNSRKFSADLLDFDLVYWCCKVKGKCFREFQWRLSILSMKMSSDFDKVYRKYWQRFHMIELKFFSSLWRRRWSSFQTKKSLIENCQESSIHKQHKLAVNRVKLWHETFWRFFCQNNLGHPLKPCKILVSIDKNHHVGSIRNSIKIV